MVIQDDFDGFTRRIGIIKGRKKGDKVITGVMIGNGGMDLTG